MNAPIPKEFIPPKRYEIHNEYADKAVGFINGLTHTKGRHARRGFNLRDWQEFCIIRPIFGHVDEEGLRIFRTVYMEIPRKNGKSEIAAAIALKMLCADGEEGAEVYSAASDRAQAAIVFNVAAQMVKNHPSLRSRCKVIHSQKTIIYRDKNGGTSKYVALSSDAYSKEGYNPSAVIADEIHAWKDKGLWEVLTDGVSARDQPLIFAITTAGAGKDSLWWELRDYAEKVRDGKVKDESSESWLPILYTAPEGADPWDEELWHQVNPALGDFKSLKDMRQKAAQAKVMKSREARFRRVQLCQVTSADFQWIPEYMWLPCAEFRENELGELHPISIELFKGRDAWVGADLSHTQDLTAVVFLFQRSEGGYYVFPYFFMPRDTIGDAEERDGAPYSQWVDEGYIIATPGGATDYDYIEELLKTQSKKFRIKQVRFDRWQATHVATHLMDFGLKVSLIGQSYADLTAPSKEFERLISKGQIRHPNNPVLNWCVDNVGTDEKGDGLKPRKVDEKKKIDGVAALIDGLSAAMLQPTKKSVYEERGVISF